MKLPVAPVDDAPELALAALSAAGVLDLSDMVVMDVECSAREVEDGSELWKVWLGNRSVHRSPTDFFHMSKVEA